MNETQATNEPQTAADELQLIRQTCVTTITMNQQILANGRETLRLAEEAVRRFQLMEKENEELRKQMHNLTQKNKDLEYALNVARRRLNNEK